MKSPSPTGTIEQRLMQAATNAAGLRATLDALRLRRMAEAHDPAPLDRLAAILFASANAEPGSATFEMDVARTLFHRRFGPVALPPSPVSPEISLVLRGQDRPDIAGEVVALVTLLSGRQIELAVAHTDIEPNTRLLSALVRNLVVIHAESDAVACNGAVSVCRAPMLALLEGLPFGLAHWPDPGTVWVGSAGSRGLAHIGIRLPEAPIYDPMFALAVARSGWCDARGLDTALDDGSGLDIADLALKLDRLGFRLMSCAGPEHAAPPADPARHWDRMALFYSRWGSPAARARSDRLESIDPMSCSKKHTVESS